jgi:hypothetical protein
MPIMFSNVRIAHSPDVGSGGFPFENHAPIGGFALVGLVIRAGDWIDAVTPIYAELRDDGTVGPERRGPSFGGHGGQVTRELRVTPGFVCVGMQTRSGNFVDAVRLLQMRWETGGLTGEPHWTEWTGGVPGGGVERQERTVETFGREVVIGIAGRAGRYVDNLTLISAEISSVTAMKLGMQESRGKRTNAGQPAVG